MVGKENKPTLKMCATVVLQASRN